MIKKTKIIVIFIVILCVMLLGVFNLTPFARFTTYILLVSSIFGYLFFFRFYKYYPKKVKFWFNIGLVLMLLSIVMQYFINGQSLISGFVANFRFFNIGVVVLIYYLVIKYKITLERLLNGLIIAGWVNLITIGSFALIGFSFDFTSEITEEVTKVHAGKLQKLLLSLVAIIYLSQYFAKGNYKLLMLSILFFSSYHWYEIQRFALLTQILIILYAVIKSKNLKAKIKTIFPSLFFGVFFSLVLFNSQYGQSIVERFSQAFLIFQEDSQITDSSTAARLWQTDIALEHFNKSPIFGNGLFRASEKVNIFGDAHFFLSDIGLIGVLYSFGVLGVLVLFFQYKYVFDNLNIGNTSIWLNISILFLLVFLIDTILTGKAIMNYSSFLFCVFLVELAKIQNKLVIK